MDELLSQLGTLATYRGTMTIFRQQENSMKHRVSGSRPSKMLRNLTCIYFRYSLKEISIINSMTRTPLTKVADMGAKLIHANT